MIASVGRYAYSVDRDSASILIYGSNRLETKLEDGTRLELVQKANYPAEGHVSILVSSAPVGPFTLKLRIPGWCHKASLSINGIPQTRELEPSSFVDVARSWSSGDRIELELDMPTQLMTAHPLVEECRGQVAVQRGPIVYCVESCDLPKDSNVLSVTIPSNAVWNVEQSEARLQGLPLLGGELLIETSGDQNNDSSLYREFRSVANRRVSCRLIPYFAWGNRGHSEMSVWIPVQR